MVEVPKQQLTAEAAELSKSRSFLAPSKTIAKHLWPINTDETLGNLQNVLDCKKIGVEKPFSRISKKKRGGALSWRILEQTAEKISEADNGTQKNRSTRLNVKFSILSLRREGIWGQSYPSFY